ncbi:MAG: response regulator [Gammaproteobacteria bacterium]|nr:response regulator [Gammaproteobacteria bacterium]
MDKKAKILLVEDDKFVQQVNNYFLESLGYDVGIVDNGKEALRVYKNGYNLIMLDIGLPDIDGIEVCKRIRDEEHDKYIPIVVLTAFDDTIEQQCRAAGADEFVVKPLLMDHMETLLAKWLSV